MQNENTKIEARKMNMKIYSIHKMLTADLLFYYAIKFLFLTRTKGLTASDIVIASAFSGIFKVIFQIPVTAIMEKIGHKKSLMIADLCQAISVIFIMLSNNLPMLIFANMIGAIGWTGKDVAEARIIKFIYSCIR